jgi:hypothetical protein
MKVLRKTSGTVREEVSGEQGSSTARRATIITVHQIDYYYGNQIKEVMTGDAMYCVRERGNNNWNTA